MNFNAVAETIVGDMLTITREGSLLDEKFLMKMRKRIHDYFLKPKTKVWITILHEDIESQYVTSFHHKTSMNITEKLVSISNEKKMRKRKGRS